MKRILIYIVLATATLLNGCNGFLDEENKSNVPASKFYATANGYKSLLNATYSSLREIYGNTPTILLAGTDLYHVGWARGHTESPLGMYQTLDPADKTVQDFYTNCFYGIGLANTSLYYGEMTEKTSVLERQKAEARFIRAHYYFLLVQHFGGVAIVTEMTDRPLLDFPRNTETEVYEFIINELTNLRPALLARATGADYGHVDQRTVDFYLSKAYLTRGWVTGSQADFTKAKEYGIAAIAGESLMPDFGSAYSAVNYGWRNKEVFWSIIYSPESLEKATTGNSQQSHFGGYLDGSPAGNKSTDGMFPLTLFGHYVFAKDVADPNNDTRYFLTYMENLYEHSMVYYDKTAAELASVPITYFYPPWWTKAYSDIPAWVAENPTQRSKTVIRKIDNPGNPDTDLAAFQAASVAFAGNSSVNYGYPTFRKFDCPGVTVFGNTSSFRDIDMARLNDAYLTVAEACIKLNDQATAATYINAIRERGIKAGDAKRTITANQATIDFLLDERARELMGHYDRWQDLKRTGTLKTRTLKYNLELQNDPNRFVGQDGNDKILRPIPQSAIDRNKANIQQNPGYPQ